jgi:hypothetical protein
VKNSSSRLLKAERFKLLPRYLPYLKVVPRQAGNLAGIGEHSNGAVSDGDRFSGGVSFSARLWLSALGTNWIAFKVDLFPVYARVQIAIFEHLPCAAVNAGIMTGQKRLRQYVIWRIDSSFACQC